MKEFEVEINIDTKGAVNSIGELEDQISDLQERLKKEKIGSDQFKALSQELITAQKQLKNTELALEALDSEQVASELGSVTGAVGDVTAAFVLLGGEDGAVEETAQNIEKAIGISMAFKGAIEGVKSGQKLFNNIIKTSTFLQKANNTVNALAGTVMKAFGVSVDTTSFAFKGLRAAIISTGIGALVVGIGLLVANFDKLSKAIRGTTVSQEAMNEASKLALENIAKELSAVDRLNKILKDESITRDDKTQAVKDLQKEYPSLLSNVDAEKDGIEKINKALLLNVRLLKLKAQQDAIAELRAEEYKKILKLQVDAQTGANVGLMAILESMDGHNTAQGTANEITNRNIKEIENQISVLDELDSKLEKQIQNLIKEGAVVEENAEASKKAANEKEEQTRDLIKLLEKELQIVSDREATTKKEVAQRNDEVKAIQEKIRALRDLTLVESEVEKFAEMQIPRMQIRAAQIIQTDNMVAANVEKVTAKKIRNIDAEYEAEEQMQKLKFQAVFTTLNAISTLTDAFAGESEQAQKKAFRINKAVGIAQTLVQTFQSAQGAYLSQLSIPTPDAPIRAGVAAGIATAAGLANVAAIAAQKFEAPSKSVSAAGGTGGGLGDVQSQAPQFNIVGNSAFNQIAGALNQPIQAYVVAQDVTTAQQLDNGIITSATLGGG
tara:strand:+ start:536 stop:2539 length:2004 start_codon:yes stop_codon:yes gene_type:complete